MRPPLCHRCEIDVLLKAPGPKEEMAYSDISFAPKLVRALRLRLPGCTDMYTSAFENETLVRGDQEIAKGYTVRKNDRVTLRPLQPDGTARPTPADAL